ncbi:MAG: PAS domain S-box protein [Nitrospinota bacterium]|nr:PAS domain S-box protein [Nitrospinota bacterium]MDH5755962.1 PAS domain S-box protein [Nitrospinota bacterium]
MISQPDDINESGIRRRKEYEVAARIEQTQLLYSHGFVGVAANLVNSLLVAVVLWGVISSVAIVSWVGLVWLATAARYFLIYKFHSATITGDNYIHWQRLMILMLLVSGSVWGMLALWLYPVDSPFHQVFLAFVLGGMIAGAVVVDSAVFEAFIVYAIFSLVPMGIRFLLHMDTIHLSMGVMGFIYLGALIIVARSIYLATERSIFLNYGRLEEKLRVEKLNEKLMLEVAERNIAEQKLRQERDLFVGGPVVLFLWKATEGWPVEYVSPNVSQFGYDSDNLADDKMLFAQMVSMKDLKRVMDEIKTHTRLGSDSFQQVYRIITADGEERWVEDFTIVIRDGEGKITHYHGYLTDTTERKRMQDKLQESEERYRLLVELSPYAVVVHAKSKVVYANNTGVRLIGGESLAEFVGKNVYDFIHPEFRQLAKDRITGLVEGGKSAPMMEQKFVKINGEVIDVEVVSAPFMYQGSPTVMSMFSDITQRKKGEDERKKLIGELSAALKKEEEERNKAEQATRLKDKFVAMVSHDLRSPFGSIISLLKVFDDDKNNPLDPQRKEIIDSVIGSGERMMAMIDELLNLTRLQTGQITVRACFFDLKSLSKLTAENNRFMAEKKKIEIVDQIQPGHRVYGDPTLLGQVMQNLVSNAVKFCDAGDTIIITVPEGRPNTVSVKDTGGGVDRDFIADLFKHEVKTTSVGSAGEIGTGLGLPFSQDIMTANGGRLEVDSQATSGATFNIVFSDQRPSILVVDDDVITRSILVNMLHRYEYDVVQAENGKEGITILEQKDFHLVVIDLFMPVFDGFAFLERARELPVKGNIPILVLTSDEKLETRDKAFQMGANDFIHKSMVKTDFLPRVNRLLSIWRGY